MARKILIVEDNPHNRKIFSDMLRSVGYEVVEAFDGREGVEKARAEMPDLVLMDLALPVMTGWEATRELKADGRTGRIPIVALTSYAMSTDEQKAREAGCDEYIPKPVSPRKVVEVVRRLLGESGEGG